MRRSKEDAEETRKLIVETALVEFAEKGYSGASLSGIAARINLTKGAVYWHFKNKDELFYTLIEEKTRSAGREMEKLIVSDLPPREKLEKYMKLYLSLLEEDCGYRAVQKILFFHMEHTEEMEEDLRSKAGYLKQLHQTFSSLIEEAVKNGSLNFTGSSETAAYALLSYIYGIANTWLFYEGGMTMTRDGAAMVDFFLKGLES